MNFRKSLLIIVSFLFSINTIYSQMTVDPQHSFYEDSQLWKTKAYINKLPPLRPYTYDNIIEILNIVINNGSEKDKIIAKQYYEELTGRAWHITVDTNLYTNNTDTMFSLHPGLTGNLQLLNGLMNFSYKLAWDLRTQKDELNIFPTYTNHPYDSIQDPGEIGPFYMYLDGNSVLSFGNENLFLQIGLNRNGYGDFLNSNIALNDSSYHSGNFSLTYTDDVFTYNQTLSILGASSNYDGKKLNPNKYMAMHLAEVNITPTMKLGYYETMIFGKRFDPIYLIPVPFMASQGLNGCKDNLQMGIIFEYNFLNKYQFKNDLFVDDMEFNKIVRFNFDGKYRIVDQIGFRYVSPLNFFNFIEADYTFITPYTYSHWEDVESGESITSNSFNYQNYTNSGIKIGSQYNSNSDIFKINASFSPINNLNIKTGLEFIRHGNISESVTSEEALTYLLADENTYATDGSIFVNTKYNNKKIPSAWNNLNFLNQEHLMYIFSPSAEITYKIPNLFGLFNTKIGLKYTYQFTHNFGINNHIYPGGQILKKDDGSYEWQGNSYLTYEDLFNNRNDIVEYYKNLWKDNLKNTHNHYFNINCSITW